MHMITSHKVCASAFPSPVISPLSFIFILWHVKPGLVAFLACQLFRASLIVIVLVELAEITVLGFHLNSSMPRVVAVDIGFVLIPQNGGLIG